MEHISLFSNTSESVVCGKVPKVPKSQTQNKTTFLYPCFSALDTVLTGAQLMGLLFWNTEYQRRLRRDWGTLHGDRGLFTTKARGRFLFRVNSLIRQALNYSGLERGKNDLYRRANWVSRLCKFCCASSEKILVWNDMQYY